MGGPSLDGGGCNTGVFSQNPYPVRVAGDRTWGFAASRGSITSSEPLDLVYADCHLIAIGLLLGCYLIAT